MTRMRLTIAALFVAAFAAGVTAALTARQWENPPTKPRGSWLGRELDLSPQQQEEMAKIWSSVGRDGWRQDAERRRALQRQREEAIRELVPKDKQAELDRIVGEYEAAMEEMSRQRRAAFDQAVEQTRAILTPQQRVKYEELLARRAEHWRSGRSRSDSPASPDEPTEHERGSR